MIKEDALMRVRWRRVERESEGVWADCEMAEEKSMSDEEGEAGEERESKEREGEADEEPSFSSPSASSRKPFCFEDCCLFALELRVFGEEKRNAEERDFDPCARLKGALLSKVSVLPWRNFFSWFRRRSRLLEEAPPLLDFLVFFARLRRLAMAEESFALRYKDASCSIPSSALAPAA